MPGRDEEKDKALKTPLETGERRTPTPAREEPQATAELDLADPVRRALGQRYDVLAEVGQGGMGIVYRARDRVTGERVALKVLRPDIAADPRVLERFKDELRLARKITHKNVCRIHELNLAEGTAYISMEFVEGESLREVLGRFGGLPLRKGIELARQISAALREAHAQGIVHRDLKPENVMLDRAGQAKVMDFGIARSVETGTTQTGAVIGTPAYMAPEQAEGKPIDARADIYALGLILYEVFTGQQAFSGDTPVAVALKQIRETPPPPRDLEPTIPAHIERAILRCLEKNPAKRFQSVDELEAALTQKLEAKPVPAEGAAEAPLPLHLTRWQRADFYLAGLALVAAAGFFYLFDRAYPYSAVQLTITRQAAADKALSVIRKFEPEARPGEANASALFLQFEFWGYYDHVLLLGLAEANRWFGEAANGWAVRNMRIGENSALVVLAPDGDLVYVELPAKRGGVWAGGKPPAPEAVLATAKSYVSELFSEDASQLTPALTSGGRGDLFDLHLKAPGPFPGSERKFWVRLRPEGLGTAQKQLRMTKRDERAWASSLESLRAGRRFFARGFLALILLVLFMLVLFFLRRLYQRTQTSALFAAGLAALALAGLVLTFPEGTFGENAWVSLPAGLVVGLIFAYVFVCVAEHYLQKAQPSRARLWLDLLRQPLRAQAAGLALLRGAGLGMFYLGVHTALLAAVGQAKLGGPSVFWLLPLSPLAEEGPILFAPRLYALSVALLGTIFWAWCLMAFPAALAARTSPRPIVLCAVPTVLWLLTAAGLPGASAFPLFPLLLFSGLQGLFFALILYRYDFLTVIAAIFTVETWLVVYPIYTIFHRIEWLESALAMLPWFLLLFLGLVIYFRPEVQAGWRRVAAVFE